MIIEPHRLVRRIPLQPHQHLSRITKQSDVFVLAHLGVPRLNAEDWTLRIDGLVRESLVLTFAELRSLPKRSIESVHQCAGYPNRPELPTRRIANAVWSGADLKSILDRAGVQKDAKYLWAYGVDHGTYEGFDAPSYLKDMPLARLAGGEVLLAYEINGEPLDAEHGFPVRLMIPGYYGTNCVKWLSRIEVAAERPEALFTTTFYNDPLQLEEPNAGLEPVWAVKPESLIVSPAPNAIVGLGPVEIWGWAWADGGVESVSVSTDDGETWRIAELESQTGRAWQRFRTVWHPSGAGAAMLAARATAKSGVVQALDRGRNAVHRVPVQIADSLG